MTHFQTAPGDNESLNCLVTWRALNNWRIARVTISSRTTNAITTPPSRRHNIRTRASLGLGTLGCTGTKRVSAQLETMAHELRWFVYDAHRIHDTSTRFCVLYGMQFGSLERGTKDWRGFCALLDALKRIRRCLEEGCKNWSSSHSTSSDHSRSRKEKTMLSTQRDNNRHLKPSPNDQ
jgi:hypothetical protein